MHSLVSDDPATRDIRSLAGQVVVSVDEVRVAIRHVRHPPPYVIDHACPAHIAGVLRADHSTVVIIDCIHRRTQRISGLLSETTLLEGIGVATRHTRTSQDGRRGPSTSDDDLGCHQALNPPR